jgi:Cu/Ag efflux protein CusF
MSPKVSAVIFFLVLMPATLALSCRPQTRLEKTTASSPTRQPAAQINNPPGFPPAVLDKPYPGTGVVTIVNRKEGWVEIEHEEIKDLMPAMQMEFWIRNPALFNDIRVGDKVDFVVVEDKVGQHLTELKRLSPGR